MMLKNKIIYLCLIFILIFPWLFNFEASYENFPTLTENTISYYQANICEISFGQFIKINSGVDFKIILDTASDLECFGRINGADLRNEEIVIYLGTNINLDFLIQSIFWLLIFFFIPKSEKYNIKNKNIYIFLIIFFIYIHLMSESNFYEFYSKSFTNRIDESYTIFSLLLSIFIIFRIFLEMLESRFYNLLPIFPFIFLLVGTYNSLNLNFYLLCFALIGIIALKEEKYLRILLIPFLLWLFLWTNFINLEFAYFDVDKIKGFSSSSYSQNSTVFWSLIYFLSLSGFINLIKSSFEKIDLNTLKNSFLYAGSSIVIFSFIASSSSIGNFLTYYYLGLNKTASKTFSSVAGNAWRGISSSAESIGEFYMIVILFTIFINYHLKNKYNFKEISFILICFFGLYRSNNFSAFLSGSVFLFIFIIFIISKSKKMTISITLLFGILASSILIFNLSVYSIEEASRKLIKEGLEISFVENLSTNERGETPIDENRFLEFINSQEENRNNVSSSLIYLIESYHYSSRNNLPNLTSLISSIATPVNRSEKWGIFFGKYDPNLKTFLFGTGVNNLSNYYFSHETKISDGLVLPHSSVLSYLVFVGLFGLTSFSMYYIYLLILNRNNFIYLFLNAFVVINLLKNDSLLYLNSFLLFVFIVNFYKFETYIAEVDNE